MEGGRFCLFGVEKKKLLRIVILLLLANSCLADHAEQLAASLISDLQQHTYEKQDLSKLIYKANNNVINCQAKANNLIDVAKNNNSLTKVIQGEFLQDLNLALPSADLPANDLFVFISLSMPEHTLQQYANLSHQYNYTLVLQGFKNNSYLATIEHMQKIILNTQAGIMVHPDLFEQFNILQVPTVILSDGKHYDQIAGNISVHYALTEIAAHGDLAILAKQRLQQL